MEPNPPNLEANHLLTYIYTYKQSNQWLLRWPDVRPAMLLHAAACGQQQHRTFTFARDVTSSNTKAAAVVAGVHSNHGC